MTDLPIVTRLEKLAAAAALTGDAPRVALWSTQAAALIRALVTAGDGLLTGTTHSCLNGDEYFRDNDDVRAKIKALRAALAKAREA